MGAGTYVGRIGGLAVALGVGAAVFTGQTVASAEPSSGSESSSTDSHASTDSSATTTDAASNRAKPTAETVARTDDSEDGPADESADHSEDDSKDEDSDDQGSDDQDSDDETGGDTTDESAASTHADDPDEKPTTRSSKRWKEAQKPADDQNDAGEAAEAIRRVPSQYTSAESAEETEDLQEQAPPTQQGAAPPVTEIVEVVVRSVVEQRPVDTGPSSAVTVAMSTLVSALVSPFAGDSDEPATPVGSPAAWALAAAARREFMGSMPALDTATAPRTTNGLVAADVSASTAVVVDEPVLARPFTPLLTPLQQVPVIGPLFVTPVVALVKQIPLIGDILHPIIGYPVGFTGGTTPRDVKVISFDGTPIYVHFFPAQGLNAGKPAPTILNGPGLGLPGETNPLAEDNPFLPNEVIGMAPLLQSGYNVVTWDPRGEWSSGGVLQIDHPDYEARDMQAIIDWIEQQPEAQLDVTGDPLIGMVGASYGGGIQLVTAAIDDRVDAIVPTIAWNDLNTSLYQAEATKTSWGAILSAALILTGARVNPQIYTAVATGLFTGQLPQRDQDFLTERSPYPLLDQITAPTLLIQGTVDTLFTLQEAHANAIALIDNGVPTKVVWYCGGHGACISGSNDGEVIERATLDWLDKYVMGLPTDTGPQFEWVDQNGQQFFSDTYPVAKGTPLSVSSGNGGTLPLFGILGGSGPNFRALQAGPIGALLGILSGAPAKNAIELTLPEQATTQYIVGAPELEFTYSGAGSSRHIYAQLVDDTTGLVLGNQVTPIPVTLDGELHTVKIPLEMVAHTLTPGQTVTVQLVASAVTYQTLGSFGRIDVSNMTLTLPTADAAEVSSPGTSLSSVA